MTTTIERPHTLRRLTDEEWDRIAPLIPQPQRQGMQKKVTDRQMVDALLYREYKKVSWSKIPGLETAHMTISKRFSRWKANGTLERIYESLRQMDLLPEADPHEPPSAERSLPPPERPLEWWELTDQQWEQLAPLFPPEPENQGSKYKTNRQILDILLFREYTNTAWRDMPRSFGPWRTVYARYTKWHDEGFFEHLLGKMKQLGILNEENYLKTAQPQPNQQEPADWWEVTEEQWQRLSLLLRLEDFNKRGKKVKNDRQMLNGILCKYRSGVVWMKLPEKYGPWRTVMERYRKWRDDGTLYQLFHELGLSELLAEATAGGPAADAGAERPLEWWELTDSQWAQVADLLPPDQPLPGGRSKTNRQVLDALLYREYTNTPWRELPQASVSWRTAYERYAHWKRLGVLGTVFGALKRAGVMTEEKYRRGHQDGWEENSLYWWEVTDEQWQKLLPLFPPENINRTGRREKGSRQILNAILCRYYTGIPWLDLPKKYGPWRTIIKRYQLWRDMGLLDQVFAQLNSK